MLRNITLKDFVIIQQLSLDLEIGLTVITGETGAGKSIIIDALGLLLGERADSSVVREGCEQTEIIGHFDLTASAHEWLAGQDLSSPDPCIIRRVINRNGRSKAYLNENSIKVQDLSVFGETLVEIHSQHAHQALMRAETQRQLLDGMNQPNRALQAVKQTFTHWKQLRNKLKQLGGFSADRNAQLTLLRYQVEELETLELTDSSLAALEAEHTRLAYANQLLEGAQSALTVLESSSEQDNSSSAVSSLSHALREVENIQTHDEKLTPIVEMLDAAMIQAQEAASELQHYLNNLDIDPQRLDWLEQRLAQLQDTARKHQVKVEELPALLKQLQEQLDVLENYEQRAATLEADLQKALQSYRTAAAHLSQQRTDTAQSLSADITDNMQHLGMPNGRLVIKIQAQTDATPTLFGTDNVTFLVSANLGQSPKPLHKAASGGELSRISLAIQVITAQASNVATLVFDEVDVGIGGGVAEIVGQKLAALGKQQQVLCITHLPQVAACGHQHLRVRKQAQKDSTLTDLVRLSTNERTQEIARMLGGIEITAQTLAHAQEMLTLNH